MLCALLCAWPLSISVRCQNAPPPNIAYAYDAKDFQVRGGSNWIDRDHYDITAKLERVDQQRPGRIQIREPLRTLRAISIEVPSRIEGTGRLRAVRAKGGFKLTPVTDEGNHDASSEGGATRQLS